MAEGRSLFCREITDMICLQMLGTGSGRQELVVMRPHFRVFNPEIQQKKIKTEPISGNG
jgi:hypothetical protein